MVNGAEMCAVDSFEECSFLFTTRVALRLNDRGEQGCVLRCRKEMHDANEVQTSGDR